MNKRLIYNLGDELNWKGEIWRIVGIDHSDQNIHAVDCKPWDYVLSSRVETKKVKERDLEGATLRITAPSDSVGYQ